MSKYISREEFYKNLGSAVPAGPRVTKELPKKQEPKKQEIKRAEPYSPSVRRVGQKLPTAVRQNIAAKTYEDFDNAGAKLLGGFAQGISPVDTKKNLHPAIQQNLSDFTDGAYAAGNIAGTMAQFAMPYAGLGEMAVGGVAKVAPKVLPAAAGLVEKGIGKVAPKLAGKGIGQRVAESAAKDLVIGAPLNFNTAFNKEGLRGKELAANMALNTALDIGVGGVLEAAPVILKSGKKIASQGDFDALTPIEKEEAIRLLPEPKIYAGEKGSSFNIEDFSKPEQKFETVPEVRDTSTIKGFDNSDVFEDFLADDDIAIINWLKTKGDAKETADKIVTNYRAKVDAAADALAEDLKKYKPQGVDIAFLPSESSGAVLGEAPVRISKNEQWYGDFYKENKRAPNKGEMKDIAKSLIEDDLKRGGGNYADPELAEKHELVRQVERIAAQVDKNLLDVSPTSSGDYRVRYGKQTKVPVPDYEAAKGKTETPFMVYPGEVAVNKLPTAKELAEPDAKPEVISSKPDAFSKGEPLHIVDPKMQEATTGLKKAYRGLYKSLVSNQEGTERFAKQQKRTKGENIANADDYVQAVRTSKGTSKFIFNDSLVGIRGDVLDNKSYKELMGQIPGKQMKDFNEYAQHLHNIDRTAQGKPVYRQTSAEESKKIVDSLLGKHPEFKKYSKDITDWWDKFTHEWLVKSGRISQKQYDAMREMYPNYIPTYRVDKRISAGKAFGNIINSPKTIKAAKGGESEVVPLEDSFLGQVSRIVEGTRKNDVYLDIIKTIRDNPDEFATFGRYIGKEGAELKNQPLEEFFDELDIENLKEVKDGLYRLTAYEDGKPISAYISKDIKDSLVYLDSPIQDEKLKAAHAAGNLITGKVKAVTTGLNPVFAAANALRDIPTYLIHSQANPLRATSSLGKAVMQIAQNGDMYKQYKAMGGKMSGYYAQHKGFKENLAPKGVLPKAGEAIKKPLERFGETTETIPRLAEYMNLVKKYGDTPEGRLKAMQGAADVTVNFSRTASVTKALDGWVMYLNAAMQGLDKTARQVKNRPGRTIGMSAALITAPQIALHMINNDNPHYKDLDDRTKQNYYVIGMKGTEDDNGNPTKFWRIPMTREYGAIFGASLDVISDMVEGKPNPMKGFKETVATNFAPPNPVTDNILSPIMQDIPSNKDFAGRNIITQSMQNLDPIYQTDIKTSGAANKIAETVNRVLPTAPEMLRSPMKIDYLMGSYGGYPAQVIKAATSQQNPSVKEGLAEFLSETGGRTFVDPYGRRFTADPRYQSGPVDDFYDAYDKAERDVSNQKYGENVPGDWITPEEKKLSAYRQAADEISGLRKQEKEVLASGLSKDEKQKKIDNIRQQILDVSKGAERRAQEAYDNYVFKYIPEISMLSDDRQSIYRKNLKKTGLKPESYREILSGMDLDGNKSVSQKEAQETLDKSKLTKEQKYYVWKAVNKGWKTNPYE